ncbi:G protein-coupled receptor kinase [Plasmodiophora brassicae]
MEIIQQFAENETYLFALRQQGQVEIALTVPDVSKAEVAQMRVSETLDAILQEPLGNVFFNHFLRDANCLDMAMFLQEVGEFDELPIGRYRGFVRNRIINKYLRRTSLSAVTVPESSRDVILQRVATSADDIDIFASVKLSVQRDLLMDVFPEFLRSPYYSRLLAFRAKETMTVCREDFEFIRVLGKGGFGKVYAARKLDTRQMYACKEMSKDKVYERKRERLLQNERHFLTRVNHPFIVGLHYAFQDKTNLYFVMDLVTGGELEYHLHNRGKFPGNWVRFFVAGITLALEHLHSMSIVYRDLKLENVLLDADGFVMLADLGLCSTVPDGQQLFEHCGTRSFMAPEQCTSGYRFEVDWWALGVCTYKMLTNRNPFTKIWREQDKPKEGIVSSILTRSIRQLTNLKSSMSRRDTRTKSPMAAAIPIAEAGGDKEGGGDPGSPSSMKTALADIEKKKQMETMRRRKTTLLRGMFETALREMTWPDNVDETAKSFVQAMLQMDPNVRLGHNGAQEVKNHEFFKGFDWVRLERKHLVPPFVPSTTIVNAEYVESPEAAASKNKYPPFPDFDYVARTTFQKEVVNTMHDFGDLLYYRKHPPPQKLT